MKKENVLLRRLESRKELDSFKKIQRRIEKNWEKTRESCNHEITVTTWKMDSDEELLLSITRPRTYCLKCLEHLCPRKYLPMKLVEQIRNSVEIDFRNYPRICSDWGVRRYEKNLEELYKDVYESYSDLSDYEIGEIMKRRMEAIEAFI